mmetsp:Transcript_53364/g.109257  ORF Transcript_53364/g.109257 Transcript_53364/m.109257 type:complete len:266 (+) Transcript_53364:114-911(+)
MRLPRGSASTATTGLGTAAAAFGGAGPAPPSRVACGVAADGAGALATAGPASADKPGRCTKGLAVERGFMPGRCAGRGFWDSGAEHGAVPVSVPGRLPQRERLGSAQDGGWVARREPWPSQSRIGGGLCCGPGHPRLLQYAGLLGRGPGFQCVSGWRHQCDLQGLAVAKAHSEGGTGGLREDRLRGGARDTSVPPEPTDADNIDDIGAASSTTSHDGGGPTCQQPPCGFPGSGELGPGGLGPGDGSAPARACGRRSRSRGHGRSP